MSLCIPNVVNTNIWKSVGHVFFFIIGAFRYGDERIKFWVKGQRSKFKISVGPTCWIMHFLALLTYYLENYWTAFCPTLSVNAFLDKDECVNFGGQKVKVEVTA